MGDKVLNHVGFVPQQSTDKIGDFSIDNHRFRLQVCTKPYISHFTATVFCYFLFHYSYQKIELSANRHEFTNSVFLINFWLSM